LLGNPLGVVTCGAASSDDFKTFFVQALANGGPDSTHSACDVRYFLTHFYLLFDMD
jgi:hypothetical protein